MNDTHDLIMAGATLALGTMDPTQREALTSELPQLHRLAKAFLGEATAPSPTELLELIERILPAFGAVSVTPPQLQKFAVRLQHAATWLADASTTYLKVAAARTAAEWSPASTRDPKAN